MAGVTLLVLHEQIEAHTTTVSYTVADGQAEWEGDWEFSDLGADPSPAGTERVTIPFTGTAFALTVRRGAYRGYLFVTIDGRPANLLPREARGAYLVLTSPDYKSEVVTIPVAAGLSDGPHVALVQAERGWDQWPLVGWSVSRGPYAGWIRRGLAATLALGCFALGGCIFFLLDAFGAVTPQHSTDSVPQAVPVSSNCQPLEPSAPIWAMLAVLGSTVVFYFSPWAWLTAASGLIAALLILWRLELGMMVVALVAPFYLYPRPLWGKAFAVAELAILLCGVRWGTRMLLNVIRRTDHVCTRRSQNARHSVHVNGLDFAVIVFVLLAVGSLSQAQQMREALRELRVLIIEPALFYFLLRVGRLSSRTVHRIIDAFLIGALLVAIIGLTQYTLGINVITAEQGFRRLRSVYGSPNSVGLYMGRALPLLLAFSSEAGVPRWRRLLYGGACIPVTAAAVLSFSKGALLLGLPLSLLALGFLAGGRWRSIAIGVIVLLLFAVVPLLSTPRFAPLLDLRAGTTFFRLQLWRSAWAMFLDYPWLGTGPDQFLYLYRSRYILPAAWQEPDLSQAHNIVLDYLTRTGIAGLMTGVWLQIGFWRQLLPLRRSIHPFSRALALGLMGSMANFLAHGLVDASYFLIDLAIVFFLTLGVSQWLVQYEQKVPELAK